MRDGIWKMNRPKVFGIGFHKTGTSSLRDALDLLGYRVRGIFGKADPDIATNALARALSIVDRFDAFQDNPWPIFYRELDQHAPGSKFILTERDTSSWLQSALKHFGHGSTPMRRWIYGVGSPVGNEDVFVARYERHNQEVKEYFAARPDDLLVFRISDGDGWETLCPFLGLETPTAEFPHSNPGASRVRNNRTASEGAPAPLP